MRRTLTSALTLSACLLGLAPVARAQDAADLARAQVLFNDGTKLLEAGNYADACPKLADSQRLVRGVGVTLYLGECYERLGKTASAWAQFRLAESVASTKNDKRASVARERAARLEGQLSTIQITVTAPTTPGLEVTLDGSIITRSEWGSSEPIDPGPHVVKATAPQKRPWQTSVTVAPQKQTVTVNVDRLLDINPVAHTEPPKPTLLDAPTEHRPAVVAPPRPSAPSPGSEASAPPGRTQRYVALGAMGLGIAGLGLGSVFGLLAESKFKASNNEAGGCSSNNKCGQPGLDTRATGLTFATVSTVGFVVGGIAAAGGVVLFFTAPKASGTTAALVPTAGPHDASVLLYGHF